MRLWFVSLSSIGLTNLVCLLCWLHSDGRPVLTRLWLERQTIQRAARSYGLCSRDWNVRQSNETKNRFTTERTRQPFAFKATNPLANSAISGLWLFGPTPTHHSLAIRPHAKPSLFGYSAPRQPITAAHHTLQHGSPSRIVTHVGYVEYNHMVKQRGLHISFCHLWFTY